MKGDFSRVSFDPRHHFSQVLLQQGRVTLDADPNEQGAILLHYLRTMARDLFGPYGAPADNAGFGLEFTDGEDGPSLRIGAGRCYVQGVLCECEGCDYSEQPHFLPAPAGDAADSGDPLRRWLASRNRDDRRFWIYLDVWERHVTALEMPHLREEALGGPDTCSRMQVVWQVRALELDRITAQLKALLAALTQRRDAAVEPRERARLQARMDAVSEAMERLGQQDYVQACAAPLPLFERDPLPRLAASLDPGERLDDPCVTSPDSAYRGAENHLYRVEIHRGSEDGGQATFKWARDNGSVAAAWLSASGTRLEVAGARGFSAGQWIELSDERDDLAGRPGLLFRIASVEADGLVVDGTPSWDPDAVRPRVRRWDQVSRGDVQLLDGTVPVVEGTASDPGWIALEDGIRVRFAPDGDYRSGDYWLIPARVASGGIHWPAGDDGEALLQPPRGISHHYAPLGFVGRAANGEGVDVLQACACLVYPLSTCGVLARRDQAAPQSPGVAGRSDAAASGIVTPVAAAATSAATGATPAATATGRSRRKRRADTPQK